MLAPDSLGPTLCIGEILVEFVATAPGSGFTEPLELIGPYPSGAPAIFTDQCAKMGGQAAIIGAVGQDDFGALCVARLAQDGVDVSAVSEIPDVPTGTAFVRYRSDGDRNFIFNMWTSAAGKLEWTTQVQELATKAGHLHVMGTLLSNPIVWPLIEKAAHIIKSRGGSISFDPNARKELQADLETQSRFDALLSQTDVLLPSGSELFDAARTPVENGEGAAVERLFSIGVQEVVIKRGPAGATTMTADAATVSQPGFIVDEVDPTGAGDCFGGAYITARRLGSSMEEALRYAAAAGARNVSVRGPMEGAGTRKELDNFIARTALRQ
ncbi:MAG: sugar kinase [Pseudomonadota bacterium]